ncbi:hypothetical protein K437DRAFT_270918 [Tilletiaria anomala UBC 951]|uniref:Uncharacterized protein n=1 Tax=Tilletiaria anomala (strain ATCC 24038 / CBS 436.72 / UBC 951) TaxID=1037660 RepID=A0A066VES7_TILAU|nr:uncharacterized protein K437DRAFT_270918 [Tilletiaria anomala UBC 951]KDN37259.1 hypothetical protein K437DRAFT_270918 [Tilletiaria anomala UBC 951]
MPEPAVLRVRPDERQSSTKDSTSLWPGSGLVSADSVLPGSRSKLVPPAASGTRKPLDRSDMTESHSSAISKRSCDYSAVGSEMSARTKSGANTSITLALHLIALPSSLTARLPTTSSLASWLSGTPALNAAQQNDPSISTPSDNARSTDDEDDMPVRRGSRPRSRSSSSIASPASRSIAFRRPSVAPFRSRLEELQDVSGIAESSSSSSSDSDSPPTSSSRRCKPRVDGHRRASSANSADSTNSSPCKRRATLSSTGAAKELRVTADHRTIEETLQALAAPSRFPGLASTSTPLRNAPRRPFLGDAYEDYSAFCPRQLTHSPTRSVRVMPTLDEKSTPVDRGVLRNFDTSSPKRRSRHTKHPTVTPSISSTRTSLVNGTELPGLGLLAPPRSTSAVTLVTANCLDHVEYDKQRPRITMRFRDPWHPDHKPSPLQHPGSPASICSVPLLTISGANSSPTCKNDVLPNTPRGSLSLRRKRHATASDVPSLVFSGPWLDTGTCSRADFTPSGCVRSLPRLAHSLTMDGSLDSLLAGNSEGDVHANARTSLQASRLREMEGRLCGLYAERGMNKLPSPSPSRATPTRSAQRFIRSQSVASVWPSLMASSAVGVREAGAPPLSCNTSSPLGSPRAAAAAGTSASSLGRNRGWTDAKDSEGTVGLPPLSPTLQGAFGFGEGRSRRRPTHARMRSAKRFEDLQIDVGLAKANQATLERRPPLLAHRQGHSDYTSEAGHMRPSSSCTRQAPFFPFSPQLPDGGASDLETPPLSAASASSMSSESDAESSSGSGNECSPHPASVLASGSGFLGTLGAKPPSALRLAVKGVAEDVASLEEALLIATLGPAAGRNRRSSSFSKDSMKLKVVRASLVAPPDLRGTTMSRHRSLADDCE